MVTIPPEPTDSQPDPTPALRAELVAALHADLTEQPQRCGHSSDPMCCPYENFPILAEWFASREAPSIPITQDFDPWGAPF